MSKLKEIKDGYANIFKKHFGLLDKRTREIAEERYGICLECKHRTKLDTCRICGCYLPAKSKSLSSDCPINKWKKLSNE